MNIYPTRLVLKLTGATINQLKYWVRTGLVCPVRQGKYCFYSFKDIVTLRVLVSLRAKGLSLQKVRVGVKNLSAILPEKEFLSRLVIHTDGVDMIVAEKGNYFSAITRQRYLRFDTEQINSELIVLQENVLGAYVSVETEDSGGPGASAAGSMQGRAHESKQSGYAINNS
jgi:DNA-binding transcriptional MerR regulator